MLKTSLGEALEYKWPEASPAEEVQPRKMDEERLKTLIDYFPIGKKLRYYPEFKKEIVFDTVVVAYRVNRDFVYSGAAIGRDAGGAPLTFRTAQDAAPIPVAGLELFQFVVPDTSDLEMKLDYQRRALIGRRQQFNRGNFISLISNAGGKGVAMVDTEVANQIVLPGGPYAHSNMILLTPDPDSLAVTDQRRTERAQTRVPVTLSLRGGRLSAPCMIIDMSAGAVSLRMADLAAALPQMHGGDEVILDIDLGEAERHYIIKGAVIHHQPETCVVRLQELLKNGRFVGVGALDLVELKAGLLNYR